LVEQFTISQSTSTHEATASNKTIGAIGLLLFIIRQLLPREFAPLVLLMLPRHQQTFGLIDFHSTGNPSKNVLPFSPTPIAQAASIPIMYDCSTPLQLCRIKARRSPVAPILSICITSTPGAWAGRLATRQLWKIFWVVRDLDEAADELEDWNLGQFFTC